MPATSSTAVNSKGRCSWQAQMSMTVTWAMKAVRESMNTRMKMGTMAKGRIKMWSRMWLTSSEAMTQAMTTSE